MYQRKRVLSYLKITVKYGNETKWDLTNAITDYAHVVDISSRIKLESAAFKIA